MKPEFENSEWEWNKGAFANLKQRVHKRETDGKKVRGRANERETDYENDDGSRSQSELRRHAARHTVAQKQHARHKDRQTWSILFQLWREVGDRQAEPVSELQGVRRC